MVMKTDQERVKTLLRDTITLLCKNGLTFQTKFCIEAVIGVTLDDNDVFLVSMNEIIKSENADKASTACSESEVSGTDEFGERNHKRRRRKRSHVKAETNSVSAEELPGNDVIASAAPHKIDPVPSKRPNIKAEASDDDDDNDNDIIIVKQEMDDSWQQSCSQASDGTLPEFTGSTEVNSLGNFEQNITSLADMTLIPMGSGEGSDGWSQSHHLATESHQLSQNRYKAQRSSTVTSDQQQGTAQDATLGSQQSTDMSSTQPPTRRPRVEISARQKRELCLYKEKHVKATQAEICAQFSREWGVTIGRSTVSDILKDKAKWLLVSKDSGDVLRAKTAKYEKLESALYAWFTDARSRALSISDEKLIEKAREFGKDLNIPSDFQYSRGWLCRFKKRFGMKCYKAHGENGSAQATTVQAGRQQLQEDLRSYSPADIYNMDETGLFFRLEPTQTLATAPVAGKKKTKERITVALCSNADGSHRLKPLVIAKAAQPRCFGHDFDPAVYADYHHNKTAWMTTPVFTSWLQKFDRQMRLANRKIILLLDNAASHSSAGLTLTNITMKFLSPNTTSHIQPMDGGIIRNFKLHYRKLLTHHFMTCVDNKEPMVVNLRQALCFVKQAWSAVTPKTITNCWRHIKILPQTDSEQPIEDDNEDNMTLSQLRQMLQSLPIDQPMTADDYVNIDRSEPTGETPTHDDILAMVSDPPHFNDDDDSSDDEPPPPEKLSLSEGRQAVKTAITFLEERADLAENHLDNLLNLLSDVDKSMCNAKT